MTTVGTVMSQNLFTVRMDDTIGTIREILKVAQFHHLLVVDGKKLVGVISDRDILRVISPFIGTLSEMNRDLDILERKVHQIMTRRLITVNKTTGIDAAMKLLIEKSISCLPVVSPTGELQGIVTWRDMLKAYVQKKI